MKYYLKGYLFIYLVLSTKNILFIWNLQKYVIKVRVV